MSDNNNNNMNNKENYFSTYLMDYFISIFYNEQMLTITAYNISIFDNIKYEINIELDELKTLSKYFNNINDIKLFYNIIIRMINLKKLNIKQNGKDLIFSIIIEDINNLIPNQSINMELEFILFGEKDNNDYLDVLANEIKKLRREKNDLINENSSLKRQIESMNNQRNNPPINNNNPAVNNKIGNNLVGLQTPNDLISVNNEIKIEDVNQGNIFEIFNKKFDVQINDNMNMKELILNKKFIGNQIFLYLKKLDLPRLNKLALSFNNITDISEIPNIKFLDLEILSLSNNKIMDISPIKNANFPKLLKLWLQVNQISDISLLCEAKFEKLQLLSLSYNILTNIDCLKNCSFKQLKILALDNNKIENISILENVEFNNLEKLGLNNNRISDINVFEKVKFTGIKAIYLYENYIEDISVFSRAKLYKLEMLSLKNNKIIDISCLENSELKELTNLYLNNNNISNINGIEKSKFKLREFDLSNNKINKETNSAIIGFLKANITTFNI